MHLEIPDGDFEAFIFDCDGTLVDSMPLHHYAWTESFRHHEAPFEFTEEIFYSHAGVSELEIVRILNERFGCDLDGRSVKRRKEEIFTASLHRVQARSAVAAFALRHEGIKPMAVATGSELSIVAPCLENTGLRHLFDVIITPADVARGKPAPDMFLLAAERLGVSPSNCLVFEDGQAGIDGARAAGMQTVFIPRSTTPAPIAGSIGRKPCPPGALRDVLD